MSPRLRALSTVGVYLVLTDEIHHLNARTTASAQAADLIKDLTERIHATPGYVDIDVTTTNTTSKAPSTSPTNAPAPSPPRVLSPPGHRRTHRKPHPSSRHHRHLRRHRIFTNASLDAG